MVYSSMMYNHGTSLLIIISASVAFSLADSLIHVIIGCVNVVEVEGPRVDSSATFHALCASKANGQVKVTSTQIAVQCEFGHQDEVPTADPIYETIYSLNGKSEFWIHSNCCLYDTREVLDPTWQAIGICPPAFFQKKPGDKRKTMNPYYFWYHESPDEPQTQIPDKYQIASQDLGNSPLSDPGANSNSQEATQQREDSVISESPSDSVQSGETIADTGNQPPTYQDTGSNDIDPPDRTYTRKWRRSIPQTPM